MSEPRPPASGEFEHLVYGGLLGFASVGVLEFSDHERLDPALMVAVYCFAIAIPFLAVGVVAHYARKAGTYLQRWPDWLSYLACAAVVVGIAAVFFHFGTWFGAVFLTGCGLAVVIVRLRR